MREERRYFIYMLTSISRRALYTGVTNNLPGRLSQHRENRKGFTAQYKTFRLVYYEVFLDIRNAIAREKEIKKWRREWKANLIEQSNPEWADLFETLAS